MLSKHRHYEEQAFYCANVIKLGDFRLRKTLL